MNVNVDGEIYEGSGASKKMAKHACARAALTKLYNMSFTPHMPGKIVSTMPLSTVYSFHISFVLTIQHRYIILIYFFTGRNTTNCIPSLEGHFSADEIVPGNKNYYSKRY